MPPISTRSTHPTLTAPMHESFRLNLVADLSFGPESRRMCASSFGGRGTARVCGCGEEGVKKKLLKGISTVAFWGYLRLAESGHPRRDKIKRAFSASVYPSHAIYIWASCRFSRTTLEKNDALQVTRLDIRNTLVIPCISLTASSDDSAVDFRFPLA
jgi:hypothetical protein